MKTNKLTIMGLALAMLLGACSRDVDAPVGDVVTKDRVHSYAQVHITMPSTRAAGDWDDNFKVGEGQENAVNNILLVFYDAAGNVVGQSAGFVKEGDWVKDPDKHGIAPDVQGDNVYVKTVAVNLEEGAGLPTHLMAYVNYDETDVLDVLVDKANTYTKTPAQVIPTDLENGFFAMASAGHYKNGTYTLLTEVPDGAIYKKGDTPKEIIEIFVERVTAKVAVVGTPDMTEAPVAYEADGTEVKLVFEPEGWAAQAKGKNTMYLKHAKATPEFAWETGASEHRTYWAWSYGYNNDEMALYGGADAKFPVTGSAGENFNDNGYLLEYVAYADENANSATIKDGGFENGTFTGYTYVLENTFTADRLTDLAKNENKQVEGTNPWAATTSVVIKGEYKFEGAKKQYPDGFYLRRGSKYDSTTGKAETVNLVYPYDKEEGNTEVIEAMIAGINSFATNAEGGIAVDDCEMVYVAERPTLAGDVVESAANLRFVQLKAGTPVYKYDETSKTWVVNDAEDAFTNANLTLQKNGGFAKLYDQNRAFFYVPLKHHDASSKSQYLPLDELETGDYGIVRNTWYQLSISKIAGLGIGVGDDTDIPLPDPQDEQEFEITAHLNILDWHLVEQEVEL